MDESKVVEQKEENSEVVCMSTDPEAVIDQNLDLNDQKTELYEADDTSSNPEQKSLLEQPHSLKDVLETSPLPESKELEHISFVPINNSEAFALLERLELRSKYPKGLHLKDALCIKLEPLELSLQKETHLTSPQKLPQLILHKIMCYDSLCRSNLLPAVINEGDDDHHSVHSDENEPNDDDADDKSSCIDSVTGGIHPVDCLLALIICSDDFLRQDLFSRLAKCQLAIPFILPDPFTKKLTLPLWSLRSIIKEWDCIKEKDEVIKKIHPIIMYKMPIITFIRVGKHHQYRSKSAILNEVISDSHYDHFFHRDCEGGDYNLVLGDGLVDMCWYLPGKTALAFPDAVTFLNLHGDAREHPEQMRFLSQISSMCFVLLTEEGLELDDITTESLKQFGSSAGGITVLSSIKNIPVLLKNKALIDLKKKNVSGIKDAIRSRIKKKLDWSKTYMSIVDCCSNIQTTILIDEHSSKSYEHGLSFATEISTCIASHLSRNKHSAKDSLLPLQAEILWKVWAANDKEMQRQIQRGDKSVNEYTEEIKSEKAAVRKMQLKHVKSLTPVMNSFITSLLRFGGLSNTVFRNYFLQYLKLELDSLSRESISSTYYKYHSTQKELSQAENESQKDTLKKKLKNLQEEIITSSFGLEHLFRELGQVYEAALESQLIAENLHQDSLSRLPKAAAELLIDGYPLELMDGDAAHVPLQWVTAVLEETTKMLGDPNVFVLSVLGLQNTGKSTMLNTVFGLQFKVSAGRGTCGAFMQLLPLDDELREQTSCSYILVVDTEGLRAPELDPQKTQKHDNELATFVIGLANMTLINIYGEEVPRDMDDILQTSVHAFLRMSRVKLSPSCQFVHQNAGASVSGYVGYEKFKEKLDQFTIAAAKQENCAEKFKCFNDIIKFNDQRQVHYFPGLWKGDPPMSPINSGYSQSAQILKFRLIETLDKVSATGDMDLLRLSAFQIKLQDLWKAVLRENFVFSFKNTQETVAYQSLEIEYSKWVWEVQIEMGQWKQARENEIQAADAELAPILAQQRCEEYISDLHKIVKAKMNMFFSGKQSDILLLFRPKYEKRLKNYIEELKKEAETYFVEISRRKETIERINKANAARMEKQIQDCIVGMRREQEELIRGLRNKVLNEHQLEGIFERKVFSVRNLIGYKKENIITEDQFSSIQGVIGECPHQLLTIPALKKIIFGEILELKQVINILVVEGYIEKELKLKFNAVWSDYIKLVPRVYGETVCIKGEVERALIEFARARSYESQLVALMQEQKEKKWGAALSLFLPKENIHYTKTTNQSFPNTGPFCAYYQFPAYETINSVSDPHQAEALRMTLTLIGKLKEYLQSSYEKVQKTGFERTTIRDLVSVVDTAIYTESKNIEDKVVFTLEYRLTILLLVCSHATPEFEEKDELYREQTGPRSYLEKHVKESLFTKFKDQTKAEEAVTNTLCALLEVPIKDQIEKTIGAKIVSGMRSSRHHFSSKMALKVKILTDLYEEDNYQSYMVYVRNVKECLQQRITQYTIQYADERVAGGTRLQVLAKQEVSRLIAVVENATINSHETKIQEWLKTFSSNLAIELGPINVGNLLTGFESLTEIDLVHFKSQMQSQLRELKKTLHASFKELKCEEAMIYWRDRPHHLLADLIGCTEQCPFCGEQCDLPDDHFRQDNVQKHKTETHRPSCLRGWRTKSDVIMLDFCTSLVQYSRSTFKNDKTQQQPLPWNEYASIYPEWYIPPDIVTAETCLYWKRFVARYSKDLAVLFGAKPPNIPKGWRNITRREVTRSLKDTYPI